MPDHKVSNARSFFEMTHQKHPHFSQLHTGMFLTLSARTLAPETLADSWRSCPSRRRRGAPKQNRKNSPNDPRHLKQLIASNDANNLASA